MSSNLVFWDFDGVFVNTFHLALSLMQTHDATMTDEEYRRWFEGNINEAKTGKLIPSDKEFFAQYTPRVLEILLSPGMTKALEDISALYPSFIVSSTINSAIEKYLQEHHLSSYIQEVFGNDVSPSKVEKFHILLKKYNSTASDCVFITDTLGDIREANEVGIKSIAVLWGFHDRKTLEKGNPAGIVEKPSEIKPAIQKIFGAEE